MTDDVNHDHEPPRRSDAVTALRLAGTIIFLMATAWFVCFALMVKEDATESAVCFLSLPLCGSAVVAVTGICRRSAVARRPACGVERRQAELLLGVAACSWSPRLATAQRPRIAQHEAEHILSVGGEADTRLMSFRCKGAPSRAQ